jgi:hypothetical protein
MPNPCPLGHLAPAQLTRARLRIASEMLAQVGAPADRLPPAAREHVAQALALGLERADLCQVSPARGCSAGDDVGRRRAMTASTSSRLHKPGMEKEPES